MVILLLKANISLSTFDVSGTMYAKQFTCFMPVMLTKTLFNRDSYYPHLTDGETEAH